MSCKHCNIFSSPMSFTGVMLFLVMGMAGSVWAQNPSSKEAEPTPDWIVATINGDPKYNMGFNWRSTASDQKVQLAVGSCDVDACFEASGLSFNAKATETGNYQKAKAEGLSPDTKYSYRVGTEGYWSGVGTFKTAPKGKSGFSFLYTTDPQAGTLEEFTIARRTVEAAFKHFQDEGKRPGFWMMTGDHVDDITGNSAGEWNEYFKGQQDIFYNIPYAPIMGNHDLYAISQYNIIDIFNTETTNFTPRTAYAQKGGFNYAFVYGDVLFFALDFEGDGVNAAITNAYADQLKAWMQGIISANPTRWRVAFSHRGVRSGGTHPQIDDKMTDWMSGSTSADMGPIYGELGIDIGLHGHSHTYEVLGPVTRDGRSLVDTTVYVSGRTQTTASKSGFAGGTYNVDEGTMYFLGNRSGYKGYLDYHLRGSALYTGRIENISLPSFTVVDVGENDITFTTYTVNGNTKGGVYGNGAVTEYDKFTITKTPAVEVAKDVVPDTTVVTPAPAVVKGNKPVKLTFGPNVVSRSKTSSVNLFATGGRVADGLFKIYDRAGKIVRQISVSAAAVDGDTSRRQIGTWDLKDANGNVVPRGTYKLKKSKNESAMINVK